MLVTLGFQVRLNLSLTRQLIQLCVGAALCMLALPSHATVYFRVEPNQTNSIPNSINELNVGQSLTLLNTSVNLQHTDDTQDNIHHLMRCGPDGLSFSGGYITNLGNPDYRIQLFLDNQWKQHCNTGSTHPNFYGPYYDSNQNRNVAVRAVLHRFQDTGSSANITLPDYMTFCIANAEDGQNSSNCWYTHLNDQYYRWRTTSGSRTVTVVERIDYGDAPDTSIGVGVGDYRTKLNDNGPSHTLSTQLYLGNNVTDDESDAYTNTAADGDDSNTSNDEDSISNLSIFESAISLNKSLTLTNTTGTNAYLYAWVDWDNNGRFDLDELATNGSASNGEITVANGVTTADIEWTGLAGLVANGQHYLRMRLSSTVLPIGAATGADEDPRSYSAGGAGDVEDHLLTIRATSIVTPVNQVCVTDIFEDSLSNYMRWTGSNGSYAEQFTATSWSANLIRNNGPTIGRLEATYSDAINQANSGFVGYFVHRTDANTVREVAQYRTYYSNVADGKVEISYQYLPAAGYEANSISFEINNFWSAGIYSDDTTITVSGNYGQGRMYLHPSYNNVQTDYDPDGIDIVPDQTYTVLQLRQEHIDGTNGLAYPVFTLSAGQTISFVIDNIPVSNRTNWTFDSAHYDVSSCATGGFYDFGDALDPSSGIAANNYRTQLSDDGPRHQIATLPTIYLGATSPDADNGGLQNSNASADDDDNSNDEDKPSNVALYATSTGFTHNQMVNNSSGSDAYLYAWIDWDQNGRFDRDEFVEGGTGNGDAIVVANGSTEETLLWTSLPSLMLADTYMMRVRVSDQLLTDAATGTNEDPRSYGLAGFGEIEDQQLVVSNDPSLPQLICSASEQAATGAEIAQLSNYNDDPADGFSGVTITGDELTSNAGNSVGNPMKRFELEILAPGQAFTYPIGIEIEFRLRNYFNEDTDPMFWLTDHNNMNGVLIGDNALWVGSHATWNGTAQTINYTNRAVNPMTNNAGRVNSTYKRYRMKMYVQSDNSTTIQLTTMYDDGTVIETSPVQTGVLPVNPNNGIYFAHTTHFNDSASSSYVFGGANFVVADSSACDYGDAPDTLAGTATGNYETLAINGGPAHTIDGDIYLGSNVGDQDTDGFFDGVDANRNATDDDVEGSSANDEDGVTLPLTITDANYSLNVICNDFSSSGDLGATVHGWIDANRNGDFEVSEYATAACDDTSISTNGSANLAWSGLITSPGSSYLRLRITDTPMVDGDGIGQDDRAYNPVQHGEVEDHQITLAVPIAQCSFGSLGTGNGAGSVLDKEQVRIRRWDGLASFTNGSQSADQVWDITNPVTPSGPHTSETISTSFLPIPTVMESMTALEYSFWVGPGSYEFCGSMDDGYSIAYSYSGEQADMTLVNGEGYPNAYNNDLTASVTLSQAALIQMRMIDFNNQFQPASGAGAIPGGERFGYRVGGACIDLTTTVPDFDVCTIAKDFGDAPDDGTDNSFHTLLASGGAAHKLNGLDIYLGDIKGDLDEGSYQSTDANLDDSNDSSGTAAGNDEDAINNVVLDSAKSTFTLNLGCNDFAGGADLGAIVHGWIDFNANNQFEASEYTSRECVDDDESTTGAALLRWIDIQNVQEGNSYLRLRITNQSLPADLANTSWDERSTGEVDGGEVEDHKLVFSLESDFGDAPSSYLTIRAEAGAEHGLGSNRFYLHLGSKAADADSDGFSDGVEDYPNTATDDDQTDTSGISNGNDEDGVPGMPGLFLDSTDYQVTVVCNDHNGTDDLGGTVYGWVDFNNNGSFDASNNEFAEATCDDVDTVTDGSATLNFSGFTAATVPAITFARLRLTTETLSAADSAGFVQDGEVEDYSVIVGYKVSGKVFNDAGTDTSIANNLPFYNGVLDTGEAGIADVVVTLYDQTSGTCQSTQTDVNGDYALAALDGHNYTIYETANETIPAPGLCPPQVGTVNNDGLLENNTIADPLSYSSSSSNVITLGNVTSNNSGNNFADFSAPSFASCDADGYLTLRTPADLFAVDLFTGDTEELAANTTAPLNSDGLQVGYMMQNNHIIGEIGGTNAKLIALVDGNYQVHLLPITLTGSNININFNNATISDDGILYMTGGSTGYILKIDVNPASPTYLQEVGRPSISTFGTADFAINPLDGKIYGLRQDGTIAIFDPVTNSRDNSKKVTQVIADGSTRNYSSNHVNSSYGAIYFDQAGNMYAINNGKYTPTSPDISAPVLQIPIGNAAATNYTATIVSDLGFTMTTNDGARCRYAPLGLDFGDAPDDFDTTNNAGGPFHVTRNNEIWIGTLPPDNDVNGAPTVTADGDDLIGTTPDDEDAFDNQVRVFINSGAGQISLPITNNSGKAATLYAWVDFDQSNSFDSDERANIAIAATDINSDMTLTWSGLTGVVTGDTYLRLRICTDDATVDCNQPIGIASNGEVEDHLAKVIEGVFPNNTCDGMYQVDSDSANSFDFSATLTSSLPYLQSSILTAQTGFDNLNAIAFDRVGGVFYGSFFDSSDNLHIAMFDKTGNIVDLGMPVASADFNIVNAATGGITSILTGNPVVASADLIGQLGTISGDGQYFYLGDADSAQLLVINLSTFTVDAVNLRLPDIGMSTGGGFALPFDSDWVYDATTGLIYVTELVARTLYNINPDTGAIGTSAIDFRTTIPNAQTYGIVMGQDSFAYLMVDGEYDSDLNGSLDTNGTALYQLNILSKKAQLLGQLNGANASFSDAAGCMVGALDYGDAATGYGDVSHQFFDNDANGITDYQLGMVWDSEFFAHVSANARDDNLYTLADEDGLLLNDALVAGSNDITIDVSQTAVLNMWLDYQQGGSFEASEQLLTNYAVSAGSNNISVNLDSAAMGSYNGVTTLRIRICEQAGQCDQATDVNQGGSAVNGEVEDYQVWTSSAAIVNQTCNSATLSYGQTGSYGLLDLQTQTDPFTTGVLQQPVAIAGLTTFDGLSGLGIHPQSYLVYGIAMDTSTADNPIHLWVTDQTGTQLVDLGVVVSALHQSMNHNSQGVVNFVINQPLSQMVAGANIDSATRGAIDPSGEYLYLHNEQWQQLIRVYIRDLTFTIVSMDSALTAMGGDMAFSSSGSLYNPDLVAGQLYQLQPETGAINTLALNWNGIASVQSGGQSAGVFMDTGIFLYAISYHGIHDLDRDGTAEYHGSVMYQINTVNGDIAPMVAMDESYTDELDAAGCFVSADHGDSTFVNDGAASHGFYDSDGDGYADFRLGSQLDVEPKQSLSTDASGDDLLYLDDEDGVVMPISMVVNQLETIDVEVTSQTGATLKLNVWVDLNGNGSYRDSGEQIVNEQDVNHGNNSVDLLLAATYTSGFNGDTTMRFRLCEQANQCNHSDDIELGGVAVNGEVEDYQFNLINQIVLRGQVFEDNGIGSGVAHDGVLNGTEIGIAGFEVRAVYEGSPIVGYSAGDLISVNRTLANGRFEITLPVEVAHQDIFLKVVNQAKWIDISESDTAGYSQITNTSVIDHLMIINAAAGDSLTNLDFGKVKAPTLTPDNFTEAEPGIAVTMSHKLDTYTAGVINFSQVNEISAPINNDWSNALFRDHNCDGILDDNDLAITSISVSGVMSVCLISEVYIPINATINSTYQYDVTAQMVFEDSMSSGHSVIRTAKSQDALRVTYRGAGQLKLEKVVRNISQSGSDGVQNSAKPGDILQYTIKFTNTGSGDITNINIHDDTPIFTKLYQAIDCASMIIPSSLTCTIVTPNGSNDVGYIGFITWQLTGTLMSGASGQIIYQVEVE